MILVITDAVKLRQLWQKLYIGWWSNTFVKHCMYIDFYAHCININMKVIYL